MESELIAQAAVHATLAGWAPFVFRVPKISTKTDPLGSLVLNFYEFRHGGGTGARGQRLRLTRQPQATQVRRPHAPLQKARGTKAPKIGRTAPRTATAFALFLVKRRLQSSTESQQTFGLLCFAILDVVGVVRIAHASYEQTCQRPHVEGSVLCSFRGGHLFDPVFFSLMLKPGPHETVLRLEQLA